MTCQSCSCNVSLSNTGSACTPIMQVTKQLILVPKYDNDGDRNKVLFTDVLNQAYFTALINQADPTKRWYPLPELKNIEDVRGDNIIETFEDQSSVFIQEGARTFSGLMIASIGSGAGSAQLKGKIESFRCTEFGAYHIDKNGNLIGSLTEDGLGLYPIDIDPQSLSAMLMKTTDTTIQKLNIRFNYSTLECDENLRMIAASELGGANLLGLRGLITVYPEYSNIDNTTFTAKLYTDFGTPANPVVVKGLVAADFALFNVDDNASVTIVSVTESPDGTYVFTFASQDNGEELRLTPTKNGYDFNPVVTDLIPMPLT